MDERIKDLGEQITACPARSRCPGILQGRLVNDPVNGVPPRGLFVRPCTARLEQVEVVVLGLNPGRADPPEQSILRKAAEKHRDRLYRYIHTETVIQMKRWKYWQRMDTVLRQLGYEPGLNVVLAAEIVFCECAPPPPPPPGQRKKKRVRVGRRAINFCSDLYVDKLLPHLPHGTPVICVGGDARDWIRRSRWNEHFHWAWMDHITGAFGDPYGDMFDAGGAMKDWVLRTWQATAAGRTRGSCLSRVELADR